MNIQAMILSDWNEKWLPQLMELIVFFTGVYLIGLAMYHVTKLILPKSVSEYANDFIKTMLICAYPIGLMIARIEFGDFGFMFILVPLILITGITIPGEATPVSVWVKYFQGRLSVSLVLIKTTILMLSGFVAFYVGIFVLRLELHTRLLGFTYTTTLPPTCSTALKVPFYHGFALETLAVLYDSWFVAQKISPNALIDAAIKIINTTMLVIAGSHLTGMFMHPSKASGLTFGCGQTPYTFHLGVYWIGPFVGAWLSSKLQNRLRLSWISHGADKQKTMNSSKKKRN